MLEAKAKDQGHKRKRSPEKKKKVFTKVFQAISKKKKKKKGLHKNFSSDLYKKRFPKNFQALRKILTIQKIVLSSSRGQANFRGLEASRPRPRTSKCVLEDSTSDQHIKYKLCINNCNASQHAGFPNRLLKQVNNTKNFKLPFCIRPVQLVMHHINNVFTAETSLKNEFFNEIAA